MMDKIVEGKRRKILGVETAKKKMKKPLKEETREALNNIKIDRKALMSEEMAKLPKLEKSESLVQTHTGKICASRKKIKHELLHDFSVFKYFMFPWG